MVRTRNRIRINEDNSVSIRAAIPREVWQLCLSLAKHWKITPVLAFGILLDKLSAQVIVGRLDFLGPECVEALKRLRLREQTLAGGHEIDYTKLHVSSRAKSGYEGVYVNGQGFRAMGIDAKNPGVMINLGMFERADEAAWFRYKYYMENGLPYGMFGEAYELMKKTLPDGAHKTICYLATKHMFDMGRPLEQVPEAYRKWFSATNTDLDNDLDDALEPDLAADKNIAELHAKVNARLAREKEEGKTTSKTPTADVVGAKVPVPSPTEGVLCLDCKRKVWNGPSDRDKERFEKKVCFSCQKKRDAKPIEPPKKLGVGQFDPKNPPKFALDYDEWQKFDKDREAWSRTPNYVDGPDDVVPEEID